MKFEPVIGLARQARLRNMNMECDPQWVLDLAAERDQLRTEVEALREDAERYRWLRDPCSGAERVVMYERGDYGRGLMAYTMLDEAIDAAMAGKGATK